MFVFVRSVVTSLANNWSGWLACELQIDFMPLVSTSSCSSEALDGHQLFLSCRYVSVSFLLAVRCFDLLEWVFLDNISALAWFLIWLSFGSSSLFLSNQSSCFLLTVPRCSYDSACTIFLKIFHLFSTLFGVVQFGFSVRVVEFSLSF